MATWQLLRPEVALKTWDEALLRLDDYSPFQTYAWGEYRRAMGWEPCHWAACNERGEIVAMMLGLLRRYPLRFGMIWSEGGPVGDISVCDESLHEAIKQTTGLGRIYCRFRCDRERNIEDVLRLTTQGWCRSWFTITSDYSLSLDLNRDEKTVLGACERNWRRNLRIASERNLVVRRWINPDVDEMLSAYASMQSVKGLEAQHTREELMQLLKHLKDQLVLYRCDDEDGQLVSLLGWLILGNRAWAFFSATTEQGRKLNSSYASYWALVQHCLRTNVQSCDLAGIDPVRNHGVYRFKRAIGGAVPLEYLGEWDWASTAWLRWFGNWAISRRQRLKSAERSLKSSAMAGVKGLLAGRIPKGRLAQPAVAEHLQTSG